MGLFLGFVLVNSWIQKKHTSSSTWRLKKPAQQTTSVHAALSTLQPNENKKPHLFQIWRGCKICLGQRKPAREANLAPNKGVEMGSPSLVQKAFFSLHVNRRAPGCTHALWSALDRLSHAHAYERVPSQSALFQRLGLVSYHSKGPGDLSIRRETWDLTNRFQSRRLKGPRDMTCRPPCFLFVIDPLPPLHFPLFLILFPLSSPPPPSPAS